MKGRLFGVGVGPGDPELVTLKALRIIQNVDVIAYFARKGTRGHARAIIEPHLSGFHHEEPLVYPLTTEINAQAPRYTAALETFYVQSEARLRMHLEAGRSVAILSEGDPLFFGSYMHLHVRLHNDYDTQVIPGITAMSASWAAIKRPFCQGQEVVSVLPGTLTDEQLVGHLERSDAIVIMKVGRHLPRLRLLLDRMQLLGDAQYIAHCGQPNERCLPLAQLAPHEAAPYLSLILVPGARALSAERSAICGREG